MKKSRVSRRRKISVSHFPNGKKEFRFLNSCFPNEKTVVLLQPSKIKGFRGCAKKYFRGISLFPNEKTE